MKAKDTHFGIQFSLSGKPTIDLPDNWHLTQDGRKWLLTGPYLAGEDGLIEVYYVAEALAGKVAKIRLAVGDLPTRLTQKRWIMQAYYKHEALLTLGVNTVDISQFNDRDRPRIIFNLGDMGIDPERLITIIYLLVAMVAQSHDSKGVAKNKVTPRQIVTSPLATVKALLTKAEYRIVPEARVKDILKVLVA